MNIDGKAIADDIYRALGDSLGGEKLTLGVVMGNSDPVTESFVRIKERAAESLGVQLLRTHLSGTAPTEEAVAAVRDLTPKVDGLIVQLPLPDGIDTDLVLEAVPPEKDVDGISPNPRVLPPVAGAIKEIIDREGVTVKNARAVVVGSGRLVGKPAAALLKELGADVSVVTQGAGSLESLKNADIVVLGAGEPELVRPQHLKDGVILFDAGTSESSGRVVGDADPACADVASIFTPVPGGIGPIAIAMIFRNVSLLHAQQQSGHR